MKESIIVDTSVLVEYLKTGKGKLPDVHEKFELIVSSVTVTEILASKTFMDNSLEEEVNSFVSKYFKVMDVSESIAKLAAKIIRDHGLNFVSSVIAATAMEGNHKLLTSKKGDYSKVDNIQFLE